MISICDAGGEQIICTQQPACIMRNWCKSTVFQCSLIVSDKPKEPRTLSWNFSACLFSWFLSLPPILDASAKQCHWSTCLETHLSLGWRQPSCKRPLTMVTMVDWWWWVSIPSSPTLFPTTIQSNSIVQPVRPLSSQPTAQLRHLLHLRYKSLPKSQPPPQQQQQPLPRPKLKALLCWILT